MSVTSGRGGPGPWRQAVGRVSAEMLSPYPPGIPAALPGERLPAGLLEYLQTGVDAGMVVPNAVDGTVGGSRLRS